MKDAILFVVSMTLIFSAYRSVVVCDHWPTVGCAMKALIFVACAVSAPCIADDGVTWITLHVVDTGVSMAVLQAVPERLS